MAENASKSKLKRKRSSAEEPKSGLGSRGAAERSGEAPLSRDGAAHSDRCRPPAAAAAWWDMSQPPAVESLWAFTLMSALQNQLWDPVPDLPLPPAARPATPKGEEQWTYDLFSDAPPFPEDDPLTPRLPSDPGPQRASSPQEAASVQTRPSGRSSNKEPSSDSRQSPEPPRALSRTQRWEKAAPSSAGEPGVRGEQEERNCRLLAESLKVSNPSVPPGGEEEQSASKHEEGALQSCPMCLHVFPSGFTQMERDAHLAQCLSELSVDMTW